MSDQTHPARKAGDAGTPTSYPEQAVSSWIRERAHPVSTDPAASLEDLEPLRAIVADARVAGLGDTVRAAREPLVLCLRVVRFLVERLGFRVLALEESMLAATRLDRHVRHGYGDPDVLLREYAWEPWQTAEMGQVLAWVRRFNLDHPDDPVHIIGVDIARQSDLEPETVIAQIAPLVPQIAGELQVRYTNLAMARESSGLEPALDSARSARELIAASEPSAARGTALQYATAVVGYLEFRLSGRVAVAERHLAANTAWAHEHFDAKVIYWGGLAHVAATAHREVPGMPGIDQSAGSRLREHFGDGYVPIGFTFNHGTAPYRVPPVHDSFVDAHFARVDLDSYLFSLTGPAPEPVAQWLGRPSRLRVLGPRYRPEDDEAHHIAGDSLADRLAAIIHTQEVTTAQSLAP